MPTTYNLLLTLSSIIVVSPLGLFWFFLGDFGNLSLLVAISFPNAPLEINIHKLRISRQEKVDFHAISSR